MSSTPHAGAGEPRGHEGAHHAVTTGAHCARDGDSAHRATPAPAIVLPAVPSRVLVIGYGNTLFADDAVGPLVAREVAAWNLPGVLALERHELVPELAADLAATEEAIFVDAALAGDAVTLARLDAPSGADATRLDHALTPRALLALTETAFGRAPPAWLLTIPAADFSLGGALSETARRGVVAALERIRSRL